MVDKRIQLWNESSIWFESPRHLYLEHVSIYHCELKKKLLRYNKKI